LTQDLHDAITLVRESISLQDQLWDYQYRGDQLEHESLYGFILNTYKDALDDKETGDAPHGGYNYWATFIDDCSRKWAVVPMKHKSDTFQSFRDFKAYAENHTGKRIKCFRVDKGGEYMSNEFDFFLKGAGISREHSVRNRPQQNGVAKRANRTLSERVTAMQHSQSLVCLKHFGQSVYLHLFMY
jgi:transposase InsO family protein